MSALRKFFTLYYLGAGFVERSDYFCISYCRIQCDVALTIMSWTHPWRMIPLLAILSPPKFSPGPYIIGSRCMNDSVIGYCVRDVWWL